MFEKKKQRVLNIYCTAGYPLVESTVKIIKALADNGADVIELGMPYSDPLADGPVIQASSNKAIANGMTIEKLFHQLKEIRDAVTGVQTPIVLMGYMNPVLQYGFEKFCADAFSAGIDGLILPDLPEFEFENEYGPVIKKYNLDFIFLITPETSEARVRKLDALSSGFLYAVSSSSVTGSNKDFSAVEDYLKRLQSYNLKNPVMVGFGIKDKESFDAVCRYANGAIIGTAFISALENAPDAEAAAAEFVKSITG